MLFPQERLETITGMTAKCTGISGTHYNEATAIYTGVWRKVQENLVPITVHLQQKMQG